MARAARAAREEIGASKESAEREGTPLIQSRQAATQAREAREAREGGREEREGREARKETGARKERGYTPDLVERGGALPTQACT